jgi:hypothetical protein
MQRAGSLGNSAFREKKNPYFYASKTSFQIPFQQQTLNQA